MKFLCQGISVHPYCPVPAESFLFFESLSTGFDFFLIEDESKQEFEKYFLVQNCAHPFSEYYVVCLIMQSNLFPFKITITPERRISYEYG